MKRIITILFLYAITVSCLSAQNNVPFNAADTWIAYMNVFDLPAAGGGYQFGSSWELPKAKSTLTVAANTLILQPNFNTYEENPTDPFWVDQGTKEGNKSMEALTFVEPGATFNGSDLTFSGDVLSRNISDDYIVKVFIKALDPANGYADALGGSKVFDLPATGPFSVSATGAELAAGLIIQYGFSVTGVNANPANESTLGLVNIGVINTSTNDLREQSSISLNPNPAIDQLSITSNSRLTSYDIFNLAGQLVGSGQNETVVDISKLNSGMYFFSAQVGDKREVIKFLKK